MRCNAGQEDIAGSDDDDLSTSQPVKLVVESRCDRDTGLTRSLVALPEPRLHGLSERLTPEEATRPFDAEDDEGDADEL